jgi:DNA-binding GntR family transcriptional regulator
MPGGNVRKLVVESVDERFTLKEHVYDLLKQAIMALNIYDENTELRLDERELALQLNASRTPVREALTRLEQEGLVRIVPRRGVFILRKSVDEILEMIVVWGALESMAARLAAKIATADDIADLRSMLQSFGSNEVNSHLDEYSDANIRFHRRILELSGCELLLRMAESLFIHMRAIRARTMTEDNRANRSIVDHVHIIEAIEGRDPALAERLVREHTLNLHAHVKATWSASDSTAIHSRMS